jgi:hypothetical protein
MFCAQETQLRTQIASQLLEFQEEKERFEGLAMLSLREIIRLRKQEK